MRKIESLNRYYTLRGTFCAEQYGHCFTALRSIVRSYRKYYMTKLAWPRAWCHFEIVMWSFLNGTILSDAHFFTPSKKSGALINGGSGYPQKVILQCQLHFKMSKTLMYTGGGSPSLAGNKGI